MVVEEEVVKENVLEVNEVMMVKKEDVEAD